MDDFGCLPCGLCLFLFKPEKHFVTVQLTKGAIGSHSHAPRQSIQNTLLEVTRFARLGIQMVYQCLYSLVAVLFLMGEGKEGEEEGGEEGGGREEGGRREGGRKGRRRGGWEGGGRKKSVLHVFSFIPRCQRMRKITCMVSTMVTKASAAKSFCLVQSWFRSKCLQSR